MRLSSGHVSTESHNSFYCCSYSDVCRMIVLCIDEFVLAHDVNQPLLDAISRALIVSCKIRVLAHSIVILS